VILVADAYDAITTDRSYRPASAAEEALVELQRMSEIQFDPAVVAALEAYLVETGLIGERELLSGTAAERMVA
jgi:HD-GYP domain-containing protein (c-di-GMP phosphodiesterase class II)